jgi:CheY-like chemotaxis protein
MSIADEIGLAGISVLDVASADEAVALLEQGKLVSAVITDIRMPGRIDGRGLVRWMHEHQPHIPVIVTTGCQIDFGEDFPPVLAVLSKPYAGADIITLLRGSAS